MNCEKIRKLLKIWKRSLIGPIWNRNSVSYLDMRVERLSKSHLAAIVSIFLFLQLQRKCLFCTLFFSTKDIIKDIFHLRLIISRQPPKKLRGSESENLQMFSVVYNTYSRNNSKFSQIEMVQFFLVFRNVCACVFFPASLRFQKWSDVCSKMWIFS